ncbi:FAD-dependent oxidoreductase, partial [bacterium]|nr:FAD-dependent oxidoreductase [bacterium]
ALAAARNGARTVLIQDRSVLGGNASSEIRMHIVGADCSGRRPGWRESGIIDELRVEDAVRNPQRSMSLWDVLLYEKCRFQENLTLLLDTDCGGVERRSPARIENLHAINNLLETEYQITAPLFIDCSGDGRLGIEAGAEYHVGREAKHEYGESLAPDQADNQTLGSSIQFCARDHGRPMPFVAPAWARPFTDADLAVGRGHDNWKYGYWWCEWGGQLDTIGDNDRIRHELLRIALGVWDHIKNSGEHPGSETWALEWLGFLPGKRESRRFIGDHRLTQQDVGNGICHADDVAYGGWPIDTHPPAGVDAVTEQPCTQQFVPDCYGIPLRALYSRNVANLLFAGRNISATHVAFASTRVMAPCAVMGQAVGTAAAYCARHGLVPRDLLDRGIHDVQQQLLKDDATLLRVPNEDEADLARRARVTASSAATDADAAKIVNGWFRDIPPPADQPAAAAQPAVINRWTSAPGQPLPQSVELQWPAGTTIREVHLTFDTGFQRCLTLTLSDWYDRLMIRGPQPETVRDYALEARVRGGWHRVADIHGNHLRKRVHRFEPVQTDRLRVTVTATNGAPEARVFEVRAY